MSYDEVSFLSGVAVGRNMRSWPMLDQPEGLFRFSILIREMRDVFGHPLIVPSVYRFAFQGAGTVDWGDGSTTEYGYSTSRAASHSYAEAGLYQVTFDGKLNWIRWSAVIGSGVDSDSTKALISIDAPLPEHYSTEALALDCRNMCLNCTSLVHIPRRLFSRQAASGAYLSDLDYIFTGCSALRQLPPDLFEGIEIRAESMAFAFRFCAIRQIPETLFAGVTGPMSFEYCFNDCAALTEIPAGLFDNCVGATDFSACFNGCSALTEIPAGLFDSCTNATDFSTCFAGCSSLTTVPAALFANCQAVDLRGVFRNCSLLAEAPDGVFAGCAGVTTFQNAFYGCAALMDISADLFAGCIAAESFSGTFRYSGLTEIPSGLFDDCPGATDFSWCFANLNITQIPAGLFDGCSQVTTFASTFRDTLLTGIPIGLFDDCAAAEDFSYCFYQTRLVQIPQGLFAYCPSAATFDYLCGNVVALLTAPLNAFAGTAIASIRGGFRSCYYLQYAPELWEAFPSADGTDCFYDCGGASNYSSVPSSWGGP